MLSSYENEKQRPTLETLERILAALRVDLDGLAYAMRAVAQEEQAKGGATPAPRSHPAEIDPWVDSSALNLQEVLRLPRSLESPEAHAIGQMFQGFHALLRYFLIRADGAIPNEVPPRPPSEP